MAHPPPLPHPSAGTIRSGHTELPFSSQTIANPPLPGKASLYCLHGNSYSPLKFPLKGFLFREPFSVMLLSWVSISSSLQSTHVAITLLTQTVLSATSSHVCPAAPDYKLHEGERSLFSFTKAKATCLQVVGRQNTEWRRRGNQKREHRGLHSALGQSAACCVPNGGQTFPDTVPLPHQHHHHLLSRCATYMHRPSSDAHNTPTPHFCFCFTEKETGLQNH